jgi:muramoyltetrapeptide carboxypeptidase
VGLAFGALTQIPTDSAEIEPTAPTLRDVLRGLAESLRIPCIEGIPVGHIQDQWTIPLGAQAELDADARSLRVAV